MISYRCYQSCFYSASKAYQNNSDSINVSCSPSYYPYLTWLWLVNSLMTYNDPSLDHDTFLGNCPPTPPLSQYFALSFASHSCKRKIFAIQLKLKTPRFYTVLSFSRRKPYEWSRFSSSGSIEFDSSITRTLRKVPIWLCSITESIVQ